MALQKLFFEPRMRGNDVVLSALRRFLTGRSVLFNNQMIYPQFANVLLFYSRFLNFELPDGHGSGGEGADRKRSDGKGTNCDGTNRQGTDGLCADGPGTCGLGAEGGGANRFRSIQID